MLEKSKYEFLGSKSHHASYDGSVQGIQKSVYFIYSESLQWGPPISIKVDMILQCSWICIILGRTHALQNQHKKQSHDHHLDEAFI